MRSHRLLGLAAMTALASAAPGCGGTEGASVAPAWHADPGDVSNPLPDDRLRVAGHVELRAGWAEPFVPAAAMNDKARATFDGYLDDFATLDGFSPYAPVLVPFDGDLDAASVTAASFAVVRLDAPEPKVGLTVRFHPAARFVELEPQAPLAVGARHAFVVGAGLTAGGSPVVRPADWDASTPDVALAAAAAGTAVDDVVLAVPFTTSEVRGDLVIAAESLAAVVPVLDLAEDLGNARWPRGVFDPAAFTATLAPDELAAFTSYLAHAGKVAVGTFHSRDFRGADELFDPAIVAGTAPAGDLVVEVVLVEPDPALFPPPWPTVLVQHGFNGSSRDVFVRAPVLNARGIAALGIDALHHGIRGELTTLFDATNMRSARDTFRQTVLDQIQCCRIAETGLVDVDGLAGPDLDGSCDYLGQSFGGVLGSLFAAVAPHVRTLVPNVPGGGIARILRSPVMSGLIRVLFAPAVGVIASDERYPELLPPLEWLGQWMMDPADPIHYGPLVRAEPPAYATAERHVLLQAGVDDGLIPNPQSRALAAAMGIPELAAAASDPAGIDGLWFEDLREYGITPTQSGDDDPHNILNRLPGVAAQAAEYLRSGGTVVLDPATAP
ncbi:MAG: hypothetical protein HY908_00510 [Myxococcales bacterium]|nr:hypothetical protein [Myxococcales bacterium]